MSEIFDKILIALGVVFILIAIIMLISGMLFMYVVLAVSMGIAQISLGFSMRKLSALEDRISKYIFLPSEDRYPEVICENCGREYDKDFGECPYCELKRLRRYPFRSKE